VRALVQRHPHAKRIHPEPTWYLATEVKADKHTMCLLDAEIAGIDSHISTSELLERYFDHGNKRNNDLLHQVHIIHDWVSATLHSPKVEMSKSIGVLPLIKKEPSSLTKKGERGRKRAGRVAIKMERMVTPDTVSVVQCISC
jgi:hypothetical protein